MAMVSTARVIILNTQSFACAIRFQIMSRRPTSPTSPQQRLRLQPLDQPEWWLGTKVSGRWGFAPSPGHGFGGKVWSSWLWWGAFSTVISCCRVGNGLITMCTAVSSYRIFVLVCRLSYCHGTNGPTVWCRWPYLWWWWWWGRCTRQPSVTTVLSSTNFAPALITSKLRRLALRSNWNERRQLGHHDRNQAGPKASIQPRAFLLHTVTC